MNEQVEKLIVALMVLLQEQGGERRIETQAFEAMFEQRHRKGIQVHEIDGEGLVFKLGDMPISPDDAIMN